MSRISAGTRVRLKGLSASQYNGKTGTLGAWSEAKGRYVVTLDEDEQKVRVKHVHIVLLEGAVDQEELPASSSQQLLHTAHLSKLPVVDATELDAGRVPQIFPDGALRDPAAISQHAIVANGPIGVGCVSLKRKGKGRVGFALLISESLLDLIGLGHNLADQVWLAGPNQNKLVQLVQSVGGDPNRHLALTYVINCCATMFEYSRRFCASASSPANELCWIGARKIKNKGGWQIFKRPFTKYHRTIPSEIEGGNRKCCEGRYGNGDEFQGTPLCEKCASCDQKKREGKGGPCSSDRGPMVWCPDCLITGWCSKKCRRKMKKAHARVCGDIANSLQFLGLSAVCYCCGSSSTTEGVRLRLCRKCKVAKYCSAECQKLDWDRNHRKTCRSYRT